MRINKKNAITPKIVIYLLSDTNPIGTIAAKINKIKRIGNFLMFLKGYQPNNYNYHVQTDYAKANYNSSNHWWLRSPSASYLVDQIFKA